MGWLNDLTLYGPPAIVGSDQTGTLNYNVAEYMMRADVKAALHVRTTMRADIIGHFKPCMTDIYIHIDARMAEYIRTHPYIISTHCMAVAGQIITWICDSSFAASKSAQRSRDVNRSTRF